MKLLGGCLSVFVLSGAVACSAPGGSVQQRGSGSGSGGAGSGDGGAGGGVGSSTGFGGGQGFIPTGGAGSTPSGGGAGGGCTGVTSKAEKREGGKADIIFVIDNSGSMTEEAIAVQANMNSFSQIIEASAVDASVVVISSGPATPPAGCTDPLLCLITGAIGSFTGDNGVCIEPPLGTPGVCPNGDDTNLANQYMHWREKVNSNDALAKIQSTFQGWQVMLRPDASKTFVVITDDDANPPPTAAEFTTWVNSQAVFASSLWRYSGIFCATDGPNCAAIGTVHQQLVTQTGGIVGNMANFSAGTVDQEFASVFNTLASAVIADAVPVQCEWVIPPPPEGEALDPDLVNVKFTDGGGATQTIYGVDASACPPASDFLGWYYDDPANPKRVIACADTCPVLQADDQAQIDVQFGCASEEPPIR